MTRHKIVTLVLASLLAVASVAMQTANVKADSYGSSYSGYSDGYVNSSGYTYRDGYWWKGDYAYERYQYKEPYYYYRCGYQYTGYKYVWKYRPIEVKQVVITKEDLSYEKDSAVGSEDGWRGKLLDIAKNRDKWEAQARQSAQEHNEFLQSIKFMGLDGNFRWNGYGYEMSYAQNPYEYGHVKQSTYSQFAAPQGNTVYGYKEMADIYANVDLGELYSSALRLREQSYGHESKATSEVHALIGSLAEHMTNVKEIEAKGRAAAAALKAAEAKDRATLLKEFWSAYPSSTSSTTIQRSSTSVSGGGSGVGSDSSAVGEALAAAQNVAQNKCVQCHDSQKKNGGLDMSDLSQLTPEQTKSILDRLVHTDPSKRMPLAADLGPGAPLSQTEIAAFYIAAYGTPAK